MSVPKAEFHVTIFSDPVKGGRFNVPSRCIWWAHSEFELPGFRPAFNDYYRIDMSAKRKPFVYIEEAYRSAMDTLLRAGAPAGSKAIISVLGDKVVNGQGFLLHSTPVPIWGGAWPPLASLKWCYHDWGCPHNRAARKPVKRIKRLKPKANK